MNPRISLPTLAAGALLLGAPPSAHAAADCTKVRATSVQVVPNRAGDAVTVRWKAPRGHPPKLAYRVARGGAVIGQTTRRRMVVRVSAGRLTRITVTAVVGGRKTRCRVAKTLRTRAPGGTRPTGPPGAVEAVGARPRGASAVTLSWDAAARGSRRLAGYRVLRDGRAYKKQRARTLIVRVTKRRHRLQVVAVDSAGRPGPRSSAVTVVAGHAAPSVPSGLAAADVSERAATLTWGASRARRLQRGPRGRISGYRLLRDGRMLRGVRRTRIRLTGLIASQTHVYRVVAVDSFGWISGRSQPVTVTARHAPPGAPGAPAVTSVTDTTVALGWSAGSLPAGSKLRGYRLLRDGKVVGQVAGTEATIGNLAAKSAHDWSIATVDTLGYVSAPSPATRVVQADPPPAQGSVHAFLLASTGASFAAFRAHYRQVGVVYPTFYDCNRSSALVEGRNDAHIVTWAQDRKVKVLPRFNCQSAQALHRIFTDPALREHWLSTITASAVENGWDGVNVDFESGAWDDRDLLTAFIRDLAGRLHARGKLLSQAVSAKTADVPNHPRSSIFDYEQLARYDDYVFVMAWGVKWSTSSPGAQDHLPWVEDVADYVAGMPAKDKFVLGTMLYGMDWPAGGGPSHPGAGRHYPEIQALAARPGATNVFDPGVSSMHLHYSDDAGVSHDVWYSDAPTVGLRIGVARERGLKVGFWRVGQEDPRVWDDPRIAAG